MGHKIPESAKFKILSYSLFVYFGYLIRGGAFQRRGLELDLKTYKFSLCLTFTFTNQCQPPRKNRVRNFKKSVLGQKCQSRLFSKKWDIIKNSAIKLTINFHPFSITGNFICKNRQFRKFPRQISPKSIPNKSDKFLLSPDFPHKILM